MRQRHIIAILVAAATLAAGVGCKIGSQAAPSLTGPSEMSTSLAVSVTPDVLSQDGVSQAQVIILARNAQNAPIAGMPLRLDLTSGGILAQFGQLSATQVTTGSDGRATALFTAPNAPKTAGDIVPSVTILVTPIGGDAASATPRSATIRLTVPGGGIPPSDLPKAVISFSPANPLVGADVAFDGSQSTVTVGRLTGYAWDYGDGSTGAGATATHRYGAQGDYAVKLTVTDDRGYTGSASTLVHATDTYAPSPSFMYSPVNPVVNQTVLFSASTSTAAPGRTLVSYAWDLGNGRTAAGLTTSASYPTAQDYLVTLTVTDDLGKSAVLTKSVTISRGGPVANFAYLPATPFGNQTVTFDGSTSTGVYPLTTWTWDFGDGSAAATGQIVQHIYAPAVTARTYVAKLTVTDSAGQTSTSAQAVTVSAGTGLAASFIFSPTDPVGTQSVFFNASGSNGPNAITAYAWDFGDGTVGTGLTANHAFVGCTGAATAQSQTFVVKLTVTDAIAQTATTTQQVTVKQCR